mgnify:CR=1 FL=1
MLNGEFMKRTEKFKSSPWPAAKIVKRAKKQHQPKMFFTPFGMVFEAGPFRLSDLWKTLIVLVPVLFFLYWYGTHA